MLCNTLKSALYYGKAGMLLTYLVWQNTVENAKQINMHMYTDKVETAWNMFDTLLHIQHNCVEMKNRCIKYQNNVSKYSM